LLDLGQRLQEIETRDKSRKPLRNMASFREEDDYFFFKKDFLDTGMQLILQQPTYVRGLSKDRVHMYACRPTGGRVHLCDFSKKEKLTVKQTRKEVLVWKTRIP
jgi:hypothetical protein